MNLYLIGIHHHDPACRKNLRNWFRDRRQTSSASPVFVAVEWWQERHEAEKGLREEFINSASEKWGEEPFWREEIAPTISYEPEAHLESFPDAEVVWLENSRLEMKTSVKEYLEPYEIALTGNRYIAFLPEEQQKDRYSRLVSELLRDRTSALTKISDYFNEKDGEERFWPREPERDQSWFDEKLRARLHETMDSEWAAVIVGALHLEEEQSSDTLATWLSAKGIPFEKRDIYRGTRLNDRSSGF